MAKKNDKGRKKKYIEWLKDTEKEARVKKENKTMNKRAENANRIQSDKNVADVHMKVVKKKGYKLDRKGRRRLNKLEGIRKKDISMTF
ncbi:SET domain containing protein [Cryptosporidium felis]|nr:SET domain containing protein [Cryptosporidium felis]